MADLVHITQAFALLNELIWQLRRSSLEVLLEGSYTQNIVWTKLPKGLHYMALRNMKGTLSLLEKKKKNDLRAKSTKFNASPPVPCLCDLRNYHLVSPHVW